MNRWIVAATGPSLTQDVVDRCNAAQTSGTHKIAAVNDAYRLFPNAEILYACDRAWWDLHKGCLSFKGDKWTCRDAHRHHEKTEIAKRYGLKLISGKQADGFSLDPTLIHYGSNSGFQAINLVMLRGANQIVLVGFDMRSVNGKRHFFGNHPNPLNNTSRYESWTPIFAKAAKTLPPNIEIINATPGSAITCFPIVELSCALSASFGKAALFGKTSRDITENTLAP